MIYKNAQENIHGTINCLILLKGEWVQHTQDPAIEYELSEELGAEDWEGIKPYPQAEKYAYAEQQAKEAILAELEALDLPSHTIERAIAGDKYALELVKTNEAKKAEIRVKL